MRANRSSPSAPPPPCPAPVQEHREEWSRGPAQPKSFPVYSSNTGSCARRAPHGCLMLLRVGGILMYCAMWKRSSCLICGLGPKQKCNRTTVVCPIIMLGQHVWLLCCNESEKSDQSMNVNQSCRVFPLPPLAPSGQWTEPHVAAQSLPVHHLQLCLRLPALCGQRDGHVQRPQLPGAGHLPH